MSTPANGFRLEPLATAAGGSPDAPGLWVEVVTEQRRLEALVGDWLNIASLAIDTEFVRERTYFAQAGLVQVATDTAIYLLDPVALDDLSSLAPVLSASAPVKVLHAAGEDLQLLQQLTGVAVRGVYDCQVAAPFAGRDTGLGYLNLVQSLFDVALEKDQTRSDWLARPLSEAQLSYAALDTAYLLPVYRALTAEVARAGHSERCALENERLADPQRLTTEPDSAYARIRGRERLTAQEQLRLRHLAAWRERAARSSNMPRNHVIRDAGLLNLARRRKLTASDLKGDDLMHPRAVRHHGDGLLQSHAEATQRHADSEVELLTARLDRGLCDALMPHLKRAVAAASKRAQLPPTLLASRRDLEALVVAFDGAGRRAEDTPLPEPLDGWRRELLGVDLLTVLRTRAP